MLDRGVSTFLSAAFLVGVSIGQVSPPTRIIDLANTAPNLAEWKITQSGAGGPVGTRPVPPYYVPVTIHLTDCGLRDTALYFSLVIENTRSTELQVPISLNSKLFDHPGTIRFRELLIRVGTASDPQDAATFKNDPRFAQVTLFGDKSVPNTTATLAPGERLLLRLKSSVQSNVKDLSSLRASIGAFDQTLSPADGGYQKIGTRWIPALSAISNPLTAPR